MTPNHIDYTAITAHFIDLIRRGRHQGEHTWIFSRPDSPGWPWMPGADVCVHCGVLRTNWYQEGRHRRDS